MITLEQVEKLNQFLGRVETYPLILSELQGLDAQASDIVLEKDCDYLAVCSQILQSRLQMNPDLFWNTQTWQKLIAGCSSIDPLTFEKLKSKTGFIIGL